MLIFVLVYQPDGGRFRFCGAFSSLESAQEGASAHAKSLRLCDVEVTWRHEADKWWGEVNETHSFDHWLIAQLELKP